jgi:hypothetical protein
MGRPRRKFEADTIYLVRNFCVGYRARFLPEDELNNIVWGQLLKFASEYGIKLFAFVFMQSYFEILLQAPEQNLDQFMGRVQTEIARAVNQLQREHGRFFADRYTDEPVMEDRIEEVMATVIGRPCSENLVAHPSEWPGVSSWNAHQSGEKMVGRWTESDDYWRLRRRYSEDDFSDDEIREMAATEYRMELARLPTWKDLSEDECREKIDEFARKHADVRAEAWEHYGYEDENGQKAQPPGVEEVMECSTRHRTHDWHPIRRGRCLTWCEETRAAFKVARRRDEDRYTNAAIRRRRGIGGAYFPAGMIPPGHLHCVGSPGAIASGENPQDPEEIKAREEAEKSDADACEANESGANKKAGMTDEEAIALYNAGTDPFSASSRSEQLDEDAEASG